jgi:anti-anti-sigma factor
MTWLVPVSSYPLPHRTAPFRLLPRYARRLHLLRTVPNAAHGPEPADSGPDRPGSDGQATTTVFINGELDLVTKPFFAERLRLLLRENPRRLVLDMERTSFMDCGCAQVIATAARSLPGEARLVIRHPGPGLRRVLELTGIDVCCEIEP